MRTEEEILAVLDGKNKAELDFYSLPYIDGVIDALKWALSTDHDEDMAKELFTDYIEDQE